jgi:hypothetical protein
LAHIFTVAGETVIGAGAGFKVIVTSFILTHEEGEVPVTV